jgi:hypothetical protein
MEQQEREKRAVETSTANAVSDLVVSLFTSCADFNMPTILHKFVQRILETTTRLDFSGGGGQY